MPEASNDWWDQFVANLDAWVVLGVAAQALFFSRFLVQWIASERAKRSVVPVAFWWFSISGGLLLLVYAIKRADPVFILGQSLGVFIYARNLVLIRHEKQQTRPPAGAPT